MCTLELWLPERLLREELEAPIPVRIVVPRPLHRFLRNPRDIFVPQTSFGIPGSPMAFSSHVSVGALTWDGFLVFAGFS